jgi:hypothetical protein
MAAGAGNLGSLAFSGLSLGHGKGGEWNDDWWDEGSTSEENRELGDASDPVGIVFVNAGWT